MITLAQIVSEVLGLPDIPVKALRKAKSLFLLVVMIVSPSTVAYGIILYAQHESKIYVHQFDSALKRLLPSQSPLFSPAGK